MTFYYKLVALLKKILPEKLVKKIKAYRREKRIKEYFSINQGKDFFKDIKVEDVSFKLALNPYFNAGVDYQIYKTGKWEPEISKLIKKFMPAKGVFLDIGANIGYHSLFVASLLKEEGMVYAFEPIPRLARQLESSVEDNYFHNLKVENSALSDKEGEATLSLIDENIGASSLKEAQDQNLVTEKITVKLKTLNSFLKQFPRVDLIKIDVEGNEFETLRGGVDVLRKFRPVIIMEFSHLLYENDYQGKTKEFVDFLKDLGYRFFLLSEEEIDPTSFLDDGKEQHDILCRVID